MNLSDRYWLAFVMWIGLGYTFDMKLLMLMGILAGAAASWEASADLRRERRRRIRDRDRIGGHDQ